LSLNILHVDDHPINRRLVRDILSFQGHRVTEACSGAEALAQAGRDAFDLVLMDINMPGMSGIEVVRRLPEVAGWDPETPVIALTSEVSRTIRDYIALGFSGFLPKPFTILGLAQAVHDCATSNSRPLTRVA